MDQRNVGQILEG